MAHSPSWLRIDAGAIGIMEGVAGVLVGDGGVCGLSSWRDGRGGVLGFIWSRALRVGGGEDDWLCN